MIDTTRSTAVSLLAAMDSGEVSAEEVTRAYLDRAEKLDPSLHVFLHRDAEQAVERARTIDSKRQAGHPLGKLAGVPIAIKDVRRRGRPG